MNLYKLEQTENDNCDSYDSCVVIAESSNEAQKIHPNNHHFWDSKEQKYLREADVRTWDCTTLPIKEVITRMKLPDLGLWASHRNHVTVTLLGKAKEDSEVGVVCSSFNAG